MRFGLGRLMGSETLGRGGKHCFHPRFYADEASAGFPGDGESRLCWTLRARLRRKPPRLLPRASVLCVPDTDGWSALWGLLLWSLTTIGCAHRSLKDANMPDVLSSGDREEPAGLCPSLLDRTSWSSTDRRRPEKTNRDIEEGGSQQQPHEAGAGLPLVTRSVALLRERA